MTACISRRDCRILTNHRLPQREPMESRPLLLRAVSEELCRPERKRLSSARSSARDSADPPSSARSEREPRRARRRPPVTVRLVPGAQPRGHEDVTVNQRRTARVRPANWVGCRREGIARRVITTRARYGRLLLPAQGGRAKEGSRPGFRCQSCIELRRWLVLAAASVRPRDAGKEASDPVG
jgi:hypothetical protein